MFIERCHREDWDWYNNLTPEEKTQTIIKDQPDSGLKNPAPTTKSILKHAKDICINESGEKLEDWNKDTRIDYEVVYCMVKKG